ncbi:hypothetical protein [Actinomadura rayongensis]|uniref:Uncharacterized protein n=1 Tax=Actinomadura rayongensis TaxID=1429076 RepID=A0A6I4WDX3_9ACTN|nr:hypothetical protein [Actinomadura rayongensis]MXQ66455.1 hypothetical protein [Actinomadura rayongensis]
MTAAGAGTADPVPPPEIRLTADLFGRVNGSAPQTVRHVRGGCTLLAGPDGAALALALPWGAVVAAGRSRDGRVDLSSANRHTDRFTTGPDHLAATVAAGAVPAWAVPAVAALTAHSVPPPAARIVLNRELPEALGLVDGGAARCAVSLALGDLYGPPVGPGRRPHDPSYTASLRAREAHALFVAGGEIRHLPCDLAAAGLRLLIADLGPDAPAPPAGPAPLGVVDRAAAVLRTGNVAELGPLLTEAHLPGSRAADEALAAARAAGALGGRALGRCVVALVPLTAVPGVRALITESLGRAPRFRLATPS